MSVLQATHQESNQESVIEIQSLTRQFEQQKALDGINIQVKRGQVFGIVGENGAGKTTLIKHILGLYKAQQGSVSVFGLDPVKVPEKVLAKIGYLSESPDLPGWMTIAQYMNYMSAFYPGWDKKYADKLVEALGFEPSKKIKNLSKGQQARVGLCAAQAHKPELLLLDEPSSGLDPLVRKEILSAAIRTVVDEGRTVVFSSHFLDEVERICDHLVMFSKGKVVLSASMHDVLNKHQLVVVKADESDTIDWKELPGFLKASQKRGEWSINCYTDSETLLECINTLNCEVLEHRLMNINEIFIARCPDVKSLDGE